MKLLELPGLRGGVVDFKHAQVGMRVAVGEGIESGAQDCVLYDSVLDGAGEFVLGEAAAGGHEGAKGAGEGVILFGIGAERCGGLGADDPQRQGSSRTLGSSRSWCAARRMRYSLRGSAEFAFLHG